MASTKQTTRAGDGSERKLAPLHKPGYRFLIKINPLERKRGILIPGHRFAVLGDDTIPPWELSITADSPLTIKRGSIGFREVAQFYTLFGLDLLPDFLVADDKRNMDIIRSAMEADSDALIRISAFDLASVYERNNLKAGDYLRITLLDKEGRRFSLEPLPASSIDPERRAAWFDEMRKTFAIAMKRQRIPKDNIDLIRVAYLLTNAETRVEPSASISEFVTEGGYLDFIEFGNRIYLWERNTDMAALFAAERLRIQPKDPKTLEDLLYYFGISLDIEEIECFARDALCHGESVETAIARCYSKVPGLETDPKRAQRLHTTTKDFIEKKLAGYDASKDKQIVSIRRNILSIYQQFLEWMRMTAIHDIRANDLPEQSFALLTETMKGVARYIPILNRPESIQPQLLADLQDSIPTLREMITDLILSMSPWEQVPVAHTRPQKTTKTKVPDTAGTTPKRRGRRKASVNDYVLDIRIEYIEPPIRRLILVPGNRSLKNLHEIIQDAFGWTDSHLHLFMINDEEYSEPSDEDFEPVKNESRYSLDRLSLAAGSEFLYAYDMGDDWRHIITIRDVRPADDSRADIPKCLEAERAGPLEDCGGPWGYEKLLKILKKPASKRTADERELMRWSGKFDPETVDLKDINLMLKRD